MKTKEWTLEQIRDFVKKDYPSVSARMVKCLLSYYDDFMPVREPDAPDENIPASQFQSPERVSEAERERNKTDCNSYIDRAIKMLKDEFEDDPFTAKYNGIVSLLQYAQESHTASLSTPSEQEAIAFVDWIEENQWWYDQADDDPGQSLNKNSASPEKLTTTELYQLFKSAK